MQRAINRRCMRVLRVRSTEYSVLCTSDVPGTQLFRRKRRRAAEVRASAAPAAAGNQKVARGTRCPTILCEQPGVRLTLGPSLTLRVGCGTVPRVGVRANSSVLRTPHAVAAVVAEVAVAVADGDGAAVVAAGGVELEAGELVAADGRGRCRRSCMATPARSSRRVVCACACAVDVAVACASRVAVGFELVLAWLSACLGQCCRRAAGSAGPFLAGSLPAGLHGGGPTPLSRRLLRRGLWARR